VSDEFAPPNWMSCFTSVVALVLVAAIGIGCVWFIVRVIRLAWGF